jgi:hypothetical protein
MPKTYDGLLGFGFQCPSSSIGNVNLIKLMTKQSQNNKDIMTFTYNSETSKGKIIIGHIIESIKLNSKMYKETPLDVTSINGHWEIRLHSIYFDDGSLIQIQQPLSIGIGGSVFGVNEKVFDFIVTK